ncbi:MAG: mechanosensitive ion channel [bacterium]|nr:mechanosensitive ion channel [bacterium]
MAESETSDKLPTALRLIIPLLLLVVLAVPYALWDRVAGAIDLDLFSGTMSALRAIHGVLLWLVVAFVVDRLLNILVWEGAFERRGMPVPRLLRNVASVMLYLSAVAGIIGVVFGKSLNILFAATGGAGIVIGFAVQALIADFFSGIVISLQRPFKNGDFVNIDGEWGNVHDVNWRATQIIDISNQLVTFPNSKVAGIKIINATHAGYIRQYLWITLDYEIPVDRAVRVLLAAAKAAQRDVGGRQPVAEPLKMDEHGIGYRVRFWIPNEDLWFVAYEEIIASIQRHLQVAGIRYSRWAHQEPSSRLEFHRVDDREQKLELIKDVGLFETLTAEQMDLLEKSMTRRQVSAGGDVVVQGEDGDSMFLISEGLLDVLVTFGDDEEETRVAQIDAGKFLGEISLLTGEPRTATIRAHSDCVLYEITHEVMKRLFDLRPSLVGELTEVMAQRKLNDLMAREKLSHRDAEEEKASIANQILGKIKGFFKLG